MRTEVPVYDNTIITEEFPYLGKAMGVL
jgi:hypothetical protein